MKTTSFVLLILFCAMAAAMPVFAQNPPVNCPNTDPPAPTLSACELSVKIAAEIAKITPCGANKSDRDKRNQLLKLQAELEKTKASMDLQTISDQLEKIIGRTRYSVENYRGPANNPVNTANTTTDAKSISLALNGSDSFNREVGAAAKIQYNFGNQPDGDVFHSKGKPNLKYFYCTGCSEYIFNISASYDDKWKAAPSKPGAANYSSLTQQYAGEVVQLSNLLHAHTVISGSAYHDNSQGVLYDVEPGFGVFFRWPGNPTQAQPSNHQVILGLAGQADIDMQYGDAHATTLGGLHTYLLLKYVTDKAKKNTIGFNLRGFLPAIETAANGHASAMFSDDFTLTQDKQLSLTFSVLDSYYSTVPANYSHNSLTPTFGLKFTPTAGK